MGVSKKTQDQSGFDYAMAVMKMCDILHLRHTKFWLYSDTIFNLTKYKTHQNSLLNTIHSLTRKVTKVKKANFLKGIRGSTAEVPEYLKTNSADDKVAVKTVVEGVSFGQSIGLKDDLDFDDNIGEKKRMAFLDLMIEASQSGVVINDEEIKEQVDTIMFEVSCDLTLPANTTVVIATFQIHRCEDTYRNPNTFDPDNFLPERTAKRHYYSFIPFSAGPRSCVGRKYAMLKLKVLLSTIMRNYSVTSTVKEDDYKLQGDIILKRTDGFRVKLKPRKLLAKA